LKFHQAAEIFPLLEGDEFEQLKEDIRQNGLLQPIVTYEDQIIDGRNRYRACADLKVDPTYCTWKGKGSLVDFIMSLNLHRRHLTVSQKACVAHAAVPHYAAEAKLRQLAAQNNQAGRAVREQQDNKRAVPEKIQELGNGKGADDSGGRGNDKPRPTDNGKAHEHKTKPPKKKNPEGEAVGHAAKAVGVNPHYVYDVDKIYKKDPELGGKVEKGETTISQALRQIREDAREERREANRQIVSAVPDATAAVAAGAKFATIVIDPPWDWGDEGDVNQLGRAKPDYATMSIEKLLELPVPDLADEDCHLYLWITNRSLPKGFQLIERWGFRYITNLVWSKPSFGMGNYFRGQHELILFGVKGSQMLKRKDIGTVFSWPRGPEGHSSKPIESYDLIESASPGPYLEMFARSQRPEWVQWGQNAVKAA